MGFTVQAEEGPRLPLHLIPASKLEWWMFHSIRVSCYFYLNSDYFISGCAGPSLLCGPPPSCGVWLLRAVAPLAAEQALWLTRVSRRGSQALELWHTGLAAPRYVRSSRTRGWTHASCISCTSRRILYHWATREALLLFIKSGSFSVVYHLLIHLANIY